MTEHFQYQVLLKTSVGDIDIELWSKEAPKACRNFVQLCLEGYYDGTIFHRIVKGFIAQGGDPTGTGTGELHCVLHFILYFLKFCYNVTFWIHVFLGGESVYGHPFKDEFHSRLRFIRRGLVAMANAGKDDNGSQFFFTFGATPELQNKHTIFAKVRNNCLSSFCNLAEKLLWKECPFILNFLLWTRLLEKLSLTWWNLKMRWLTTMIVQSIHQK